MRKITLAAAGAAAAAGLLVPAVATAADTANTDVTFSIAGLGGDLSITAGAVGTIVPGDNAATGILPAVSVNDYRSGSPRAYTVTASSTDFTSADQTIPKADVTYTATALVGQNGPGNLTATGPQTLDSAKAVVNRTGLVRLLETSTFTPNLNVSYANGVSAGSYTGKITLSVA